MMIESKATVEEIMQFRAFKDKATLVTKNSDCSRLVSHVTIMEAPDFYEWVTGGEFVLTTWYSLKDDPKVAEDSFRKLAPKIAAIGIKTHRFIEKIPLRIIEIAEELQLPVFEVKRETLFRELVTIIANQIQNYQLNLLVEAEQFYKKLIEAAAGDDDIKQMSRILSVKIHQPCVFMNSELRIIEQKGKLIGVNNLINVRNYLSNLFLNGGKIVLEHEVADNLVIFPCMVRQNNVGFIVVPVKILESERYVLACQQTSLFLGIRLWGLYEDLQKRKISFMDELAGNGNINEEYIRRKITKFGVDCRKEMVIGLFYLDGIADKVYSYLDLNYPNKILLRNGDYVLLVVNSNKDLGKKRGLVQVLENKEFQYIAVCSDPTKEVQKLRNYYKLALDSIQVFKHVGIRGIRNIKDLQAHVLMYRMRDSPVYEFIKSSILLPIVNFDKKYKSDLLKTLYTYIVFDSLVKTAEFLHVHVNTLRYRLEKIRELTDKNIGIPNEKQELVFAMVMADLENLSSVDWKIGFISSKDQLD